MGEGRRLAAIDIGTVTTRLLVADVDGDGVRAEVARSTDITHLGEGLGASGLLADGAMDRVADVIARYVEMMRELGVETYTAMATSASRDAGNGDVFAARLAALGVELAIIEGDTEARLAFLGATAEREPGEGILVVDCGGGSTELVLGSVDPEAGRVATISAARSIDVGSKRMTEAFLASDPPTAAELEAARGWAVDLLRPYFDRLSEKPQLMIGLAGTATTLAAIQLGLEEYDSEKVHGFELSGSDVSELLDMLACMPLEQRLGVVGLHPGRAGVIVAGTLIFETVLALSGLDSMIVSEHDILYGILLDTFREVTSR
jgi:exopolyphosphatase/guanosine-5'-triphosphate,3'-diphosphate pyrophosphatase